MFERVEYEGFSRINSDYVSQFSDPWIRPSPLSSSNVGTYHLTKLLSRKIKFYLQIRQYLLQDCMYMDLVLL